MSKSRQPKRKSLPALDDVVSRRVVPTLEQIFQLVRQINPTGSTLPASELEERYRSKSALQSLLIELFGAKLTVAESPELGPEIVEIRHRHNLQDACHARMDRLTPEARSWVRRMLDESLGDDSEPNETGTTSFAAPGANTAAPVSDSEIVDPEELLAKARVALDEFDLDRARDLLTRSVETRCGVEAVRELLRLLVDQLADNEAASSWRSRLDADVAADPEVRGLLALAAVRMADIPAAIEGIQGLESERAEEVRLELARRALSAQDFDSCERELALIPATSSCFVAAQKLGIDLRNVRIQIARARQGRLKELMHAADWSGAEQLAHELVELDPENELVRRTLRTIRARHRAAELHGRGRAIEQALSVGDAALAARLFAESEDLPRERPELQERIRAAALSAQRDRERQELDHLVRVLSGQITGESVRAFWRADDRVRATLQGRMAQMDARSAVRFVEQLGRVSGRARCHETATAVSLLLTIEQCDEPTAATRLSEALESLASHEPTMHKSPAIRELLARRREQLGAWRRDAAEAGVLRVEEMLKGRGPEGPDTRRSADEVRAEFEAADELLGTIDVDRLGDEARRRYWLLSERRKELGILEDYRHEFVRWSNEGDQIEACHVARILGDRCGDPGWQQKVEALSATIREQWLCETLEGTDVATQLQDLCLSLSDDNRWLSADGSQLVTVNGFGTHVFVRVLDLEDTTKSRAAAIRVPKKMPHTRWHVAGSSVWVFAMTHILQIDLRNWNILRCLDVTAIIGSFKDVATEWMTTTGLLWVETNHLELESATRIVDLDRRIVVRRVRSQYASELIGAPTPQVVTGFEDSSFVRAYDDRGRSLWSTHLEPGQFVRATVHPAGDGVLFWSEHYPADDDFGDGPLPEDADRDLDERILAVRVQGDGPESAIPFPDSCAGATHAMVTSLDRSRTYLVYRTGFGDLPAEIVELEPDGAGIRVVSQRTLNAAPCLAWDTTSRHVVAIVHDEGRLEVVRLDRGAAIDDIPSGVSKGEIRFHPLWAFRVERCEYCTDQPSEESRALRDRVSRRADSEYDPAVFLDCDPSTSELIDLLRTTRPDLEDPMADQIASRLRGAGPPAELALAHWSVSAGRYEDAKACLDRIPQTSEASLDDVARPHLHHLRALCALHLSGARDAALETELAERLGESKCDLSGIHLHCVLLAKTIDQLDLFDAVGPEVPVIRAIRQADVALAQGDPESAISALDIRSVWLANEDQSFTRLAFAYLEIDSDEPQWRFRKRLVLSAAVRSMNFRLNPPMPLARSTWGSDRIEDVERRAREWLGLGADDPKEEGEELE